MASIWEDRIQIAPVPRGAVAAVIPDKRVALHDIRARAEREGLRVVIVGRLAYLCRVTRRTGRAGSLEVVATERVE